ncbi:MAG: hypothetical protein ACT4OW_07365 [Nitrososphaerota archaeon]
MKIILKDPTLILTVAVGLIFSIGMLSILSQMISETENIKKTWNDMTCQELEHFRTSSEYGKLSKDESDKFGQAHLEFCK